MYAVLKIFDELGSLPFGRPGAARLLHPLSELYGHTSLAIATDLGFAESLSVLSHAKKTAAQLDRLTHQCHIVETDNAS